MIDIVLRKPAAQSQTTPDEPSLGELEGPSTLVRRGKSQSGLAEAFILQRRGKLPRWVAGQTQSRSQQFLGKHDEAEKFLKHGAIARRQSPNRGFRCCRRKLFLSWHEKNSMNGLTLGQEETMDCSRPIDALSPFIFHAFVSQSNVRSPSIILAPRVSFEVDSEMP